MEEQNISEKTLRLFFAIILPGEIMMKLSKLKKIIPELERRPFFHLHLTLLFLGETPESLIPAIKKAVRQHIVKNSAKLPPFTIVVKTLSVFKNRRKSPLILRVEDSKPLMELKKALDHSLATVPGLKLTKEMYLPHITLARLKNPPSKTLQKYLKKNPPETTFSFTVEDFYLYESVLQPEAAMYTALCRFYLK
jgi:2'-5' RNA ligase